jgi:hypothetical protein
MAQHGERGERRPPEIRIIEIEFFAAALLRLW